ncbi:MAG: DUF389 domain-containing protein [Pyrinomonadaceae bacterium]
MTSRNQDLFRLLLKVVRRWNAFRQWFSGALRADLDRKTTLYIDLSKSVTLFDLVYWLQLLFSAGIATLGLVQNSSAVIIGAMLISPLMAPILSAGLALATGDLTLGVRSVANLFLSTVLGMLFAFTLVELLPYKDQTAEILARTTPNTLDLVIALFSGAIGTIATCRETKGVVTSIPGVAIAVALMPPLCVLGYGIGLGGDAGWKIAKGGGLLYLTNLVAITFTAMLTFVLLRIDRKKVRDAIRAWRETDAESQWWMRQLHRIPRLQKAREVRSFTLRLLMILLPLVIIYVPLSQSFQQLRQQFQQQQATNKIRDVAEEFWKEAVEGRPFSDLDELRVSERDGKVEVYIRAFSNVEFTPEERLQYLNRLAGFLKKRPSDIALQIVVVPTTGKDSTRATAQPVEQVETVAEAKAKLMQQIGGALSGFRLTPPAEMVGYSVISASDGGASMTFYYLSDRDIDRDGRAALENNVRSLLNLPNLTLSLSRVDSEAMEIPFINGGSEFETDSESINGLVANLREHVNLKARVTLSANREQKTLIEAREKALNEFFVAQSGLSADRIVFVDSDAAEENTIQIFLK